MARGIAGLPKHLLPFPCEYQFTVPDATPAERITAILGDLDLQWQYQLALSTGVGYAKSNVWSRAARRKKKKQEADEAHGVESEEEEEVAEPALGFKIQLDAAETGKMVQVRWLQGKDSVLFESFCGMLKRQMTAESGTTERLHKFHGQCIG